MVHRTAAVAQLPSRPGLFLGLRTCGIQLAPPKGAIPRKAKQQDVASRDGLLRRGHLRLGRLASLMLLMVLCRDAAMRWAQTPKGCTCSTSNTGCSLP